MDNGRFFQEKAKRCRSMLALATNSEIREQLRLWARELEDLAEAVAADDQSTLNYLGETTA